LLYLPSLGLASSTDHALPVRRFPLQASLRELTSCNLICSLVERYLERSAYGLKVLAGDYYARNESEDGHADSDHESHADLHHEKTHPDASLPTYLTAATLESEEYMRFAIGCSTVFAIVGRLDRLMVVTKTLLGETYHLQHVTAV
jgi:hypothetical protein